MIFARSQELGGAREEAQVVERAHPQLRRARPRPAGTDRAAGRDTGEQYRQHAALAPVPAAAAHPGEQDGEAKRDDENFAFVGAWEHNDVDSEPTLHKEELHYENIKMTQRSYK